MSKKKTYSVHGVVILFALFIPILASYYKQVTRISPDEDLTYNKPNLAGLVISDEKPKFTSTSWLDGGYQEVMDDYNNDHWAFKEISVRLNNQLYYSCFNQLRVKGFVSGKEGYVFSEEYIFSAYGDDKIDENRIVSLMQKAKVVQDTLKKKGIDMFFVYAPGKGEYCHEFIEDKYKHPVKQTNHDLYARYGKQYGINQLDLYDLFNKLKPIAPYPLFPKFGHHWSYYGECIAMDTIIKYIEKLHHCDMPDIRFGKTVVLDSAKSRDADVLKGMNLYKNPEQNMKLAYPEVGWENDSLKNTTRVLTLSDSYWYGPVYVGVLNNAFGNGQFWYYYNRVVPSPVQGQKIEVWQLDLKENVESNDVIMLLYSDGNLSGFGNDFIFDAYEMYTSPKTYYARKERQDQIQNFAKQIRETPLLLKKATQKSNDLQIPLDSSIKIDAMKMAGMIK